MSEPSLILPSAPTLFLDYDIEHRTAITSPDETKIKNISIGMQGNDEIIETFKSSNRRAWQSVGKSWQYENDYPQDGYTLNVQFDLKDEAAVAVCLSETYTWYGEDPVNFICFGLRYISSMDPPTR